jgi:DNA-directed RNA polymerase subunit E'/Rpb7
MNTDVEHTLSKICIRTWLEPSQLDHSFSDHLLKKIKKEWEGKCDRRYGMIVEIVKIGRVVRQCVMEIIPNVIFMVEAIIRTYSPKVGDVMQVSVDKILSHGLFAHPFPKIRVFIPLMYHPQYRYSKDFTSGFLDLIQKSSELPNRIKITDSINILLKEIRFEKDGYSCLAQIKSI